MNKKAFITAEEIAEELNMSTGYAYKLIRELNEQLKAEGYITIRGRVSRPYYEEHLYGGRREA